MKHKHTLYGEYYDTIEEIPELVKVVFPKEENREPEYMKPAELVNFASDNGYYTIMHTTNWGSCDHWTSERIEKWLKEVFYRYVKLTNRGAVLGYKRQSAVVALTKDANYWKSEVWNS